MTTGYIFGPAGFSVADASTLDPAQRPAYLAPGENVSSIMSPPKRVKLGEQENISPPAIKISALGGVVKTSVLAPRNPNTQPGVYTKADLEAALQKQRTELQQKFESKQKAALAAMEQDHVLKLAVHERMSQMKTDFANKIKTKLEDYIVQITAAYGLPPPPEDLGIKYENPSDANSFTQVSQPEATDSIPTVRIHKDVSETSVVPPLSPSLSFDEAGMFNNNTLHCLESFESLFESSNAYDSKLLDVIASPIRALSPAFERVADDNRSHTFDPLPLNLTHAVQVFTQPGMVVAPTDAATTSSSDAYEEDIVNAFKAASKRGRPKGGSANKKTTPDEEILAAANTDPSLATDQSKKRKTPLRKSNPTQPPPRPVMTQEVPVVVPPPIPQPPIVVTGPATRSQAPAKSPTLPKPTPDLAIQPRSGVPKRSTAKPATVSTKSRQQDPELFVKGLPPSVTLDVLQTFFAPVNVLSFTPGLSGTGFIQFESVEDAIAARAAKNNTKIHGNIIELVFDKN